MIRLIIKCDGCGAESRMSAKKQPRAHVLRHALQMAGWLVGMRGGRDYCPQCRKAINAGLAGEMKE